MERGGGVFPATDIYPYGTGELKVSFDNLDEKITSITITNIVDESDRLTTISHPISITIDISYDVSYE